jgi:hypothetical protein
MSSLDVIVACEEYWPANKGDCNKFAKAVAKDFDITLTGNADAIVDHVRKKWRKLADGKAAKKAADDGAFVIAGLKGSEQTPPAANGHVCVVVAGALAHNKYPTAYWGRLGGEGERNKTLNYAWKKVDRDKVTYAAAPDID